MAFKIHFMLTITLWGRFDWGSAWLKITQETSTRQKADFCNKNFFGRWQPFCCSKKASCAILKSMTTNKYQIDLVNFNASQDFLFLLPQWTHYLQLFCHMHTWTKDIPVGHSRVCKVGLYYKSLGLWGLEHILETAFIIKSIHILMKYLRIWGSGLAPKSSY